MRHFHWSLARFLQIILLGAAAQDGTLRSWDFSAGGRPIQSFTGHRAWIVDLSFDQSKLVTAAKDGSVRVCAPSAPSPNETSPSASQARSGRQGKP